jgi:hypothetical protein
MEATSFVNKDEFEAFAQNVVTKTEFEAFALSTKDEFEALAQSVVSKTEFEAFAKKTDDAIAKCVTKEQFLSLDSKVDEFQSNIMTELHGMRLLMERIAQGGATRYVWKD